MAMIKLDPNVFVFFTFIVHFKSTCLNFRLKYWMCFEETMSDREHTRWQHNRIYPHPISPCVYTYD